MNKLQKGINIVNGKKTDVAIGNSTNFGGYMYVDFQYTEFDW